MLQAPWSLSRTATKMDVMLTEERQIFATTKEEGT